MKWCDMEKGEKNESSLHNTKTLRDKIEALNQCELIRESDQILKYAWQNIVLVVSLMVFIMFIGYQFMMKYDKENNQHAIVSEETMAFDDVHVAEMDEMIDILE